MLFSKLIMHILFTLVFEFSVIQLLDVECSEVFWNDLIDSHIISGLLNLSMNFCLVSGFSNGLCFIFLLNLCIRLLFG